MYAISEGELSRLLSISISLDQVNATLSSERESWKQTSAELVGSLESSKNEVAWLRGELAPLMTELPALRETSAALSLSLATSEASTASWRTQAEVSEKQLEASAKSMMQYAGDLSRAEQLMDRWRLTALILAGLGALKLAAEFLM
ncbi:MAG: hypothetical protein A2001_01380 [Treponema sp. GWC1_61_84]|nr:MAG: hypothetical protein A2001_01380 [Treponema sp. GWC1_61_84]